jgi:hypothetical protein
LRVALDSPFVWRAPQARDVRERGAAMGGRAPIRTAALLASAMGFSCAPSWPAPDPVTWPGFAAALEHERARRPSAPWAATVRFQLFEPVSGRTIDGRGGIATAPGSAMRMILVGGPGSTVLDAWITRDHWRIAVPAAGIVRRGGASDRPLDLPVGFLRWWFIAPLAGALVAAKAVPPGDAWLLRDGDAEVTLRSGPCGGDHLRHLLDATRRERGRKERVFECRISDALSPGDRAAYVDQSSGLAVGMEIESVASTPPEADAFRDPDSAPADVTPIETP